MINAKYKKILITLIKKHLPTCKIYLYGSRARGSALMGSDIDLALDAHEKINSTMLALIKEELEESTIPYFVDIIDLYNVSTAFKKAITKDMILWIN